MSSFICHFATLNLKAVFYIKQRYVLDILITSLAMKLFLGRNKTNSNC